MNTPDLRNRVTWGDDTPGQYKTAGLPNITGELVTGRDLAGDFRQSGAFTNSVLWGTSYSRHTAGAGYQVRAILDASLSNAIYGSAETVQPPAYTVKYLVRALP